MNATAERLIGSTVRAADGDRIGKITNVYLDEETGSPDWGLVKSGAIRTTESFVPLHRAEVSSSEVIVPFEKQDVESAPDIYVADHISERDVAILEDHYGSAAGTQTPATPSRPSTPGTRGTSDTAQPSSAEASRTPSSRTGREPRQDRGRAAVTRSEEELVVGRSERESGRVRLRRYVVTEPVEMTVPVRKEQVRVEREPVRGTAPDADRIGETEQELTLHEEHAEVSKRVTPKEQVRLTKETVTEETPVSAELRKERIDVDEPTGRDGGGFGRQLRSDRSTDIGRGTAEEAGQGGHRRR